MKDTFLTINYKGFYINSCYDNDLKKEEIKAFGIIQGRRFERDCKSLQSAKVWITRVIKQHYN